MYNSPLLSYDLWHKCVIELSSLFLFIHWCVI